MADPSIAADEVWARRPSLAFRRVDEEGVVLDIAQRRLRGLNLTAWTIFELLDGERTVADIGALMAARYEVSRDDATRDAAAFLQLLRERDLVERCR